MNSVLLDLQSHGGALDVSVSHAALQHVAAGLIPSYLRLYTPTRIVAFGSQDRAATGYSRAVEIARHLGFRPLERLAGGRAAVFHEETLAFSFAVPDTNPAANTQDRFELVSEAIRDTLRGIGLQAHIGAVPGEYCPGAWSINIAQRVKVAGIGQRLVKGGAHVGGVIVIDDHSLIRRTLVPVYEALDISWDADTTGSIAQFSAAVTRESVGRALIDSFGSRFHMVTTETSETLLTKAKTLVGRHEPLVA